MFEELFIDPGTIARYRATPLLAERLSYLVALRTRGRSTADIARGRGSSDQAGSSSRLT